MHHLPPNMSSFLHKTYKILGATLGLPFSSNGLPDCKHHISAVKLEKGICSTSITVKKKYILKLALWFGGVMR